MNATSTGAARLLTLPGWMGSGPEHWQTRWEGLHGCMRVEQSDWVWPRRGDWQARLDEVVQSERTPVVLLAHSLGCHLVAAWAANSRLTLRVTAALLVAPPDIDRLDLPPQLAGWRPAVRSRLPFPALTVFSSNDAYCGPEAAAGMATDWGASRVDLGPLGHLNSESGLGDWVQGWALLQGLLAQRG